jgi:23S rRNA U2552 (ribose-2'-O)-methylase RlmE/FtsJ
MVTKLILSISSEESLEDPKDADSIPQLCDINKQVYDIVTYHKNKITEFHKNKTWDRFKKLSNEYELIFTSPNTGSNVSKYSPVSRSFFKLWEILYDFHTDIFTCEKNRMRALFLAEGPGGFAEAFIKYRKDDKKEKDEYYGMTLKANNNKSIPDWKLQKECMQQVNVLFGADNTGNLYNLDNINFLQHHIGKQSVDFITADGGFDFSADFNGQEETSLRLILCEILTALKLQRQGGCFVLKVFDMFQESTLKSLHILSDSYETIYIIKPLTSRPANSEKYILCSKFKGDIKKVQYHINLLETVLTNYTDSKMHHLMSSIPFNYSVLASLVNYNIFYSLRQVFYIERTIQHIKELYQAGNNDKVDSIQKEHHTKSIKWCKKYNIPYS